MHMALTSAPGKAASAPEEHKLKGYQSHISLARLCGKALLSESAAMAVDTPEKYVDVVKCLDVLTCI